MAFRIPDSCRAAFRIDVLAGPLISVGIAFMLLSEAVLRKTLWAPQWMFIALISIRFGAMIFSPAWGGLSHQRRKSPLIAGGAITAGVLLILMAAIVPALYHVLPSGGLQWEFLGANPAMLAFSLMAMLVFVACSGLNTLQVAVYRENYPPNLRAQIVSRINLRRVGLMLLVSVGTALLMDRQPFYYIPLWLVGGGGMIIGGLHYRRMTVLNEEGLSARPNVAEMWRRVVPSNIVRLMRANPHFLRFEICQTFHGAGNLVCQAAFGLVMIDELGLGYFHIVAITQIAPPVMELLSTTLWAPVVDRLSPARARVFNSPFWVLSMLLFPLCALIPGGAVFAYLAFASRGVAQGGSKLLWTLGPLHYASKDEPAHYLAAHNFVTGLRGLVAVGVGGLFYLWVGKWVFLLGAALMITAMILFYRLDLAEKRDPDFHGESDALPAE